MLKRVSIRLFQVVTAVAMTAVILVAIAVVLATAEKPEINVAREWNAAISQLGIEPVYPLQEDITVGDILLNVSGAAGSNLDQRGLLGRSVRIGHIDLTDRLKAGYTETYQFSETTPRRKDEEIWPQAASEKSIFDVPETRTRLPIVVFPEFKVSVSAKATTAAAIASGFLARVGIVSDWTQTADIELRIPAAETYGVNSIVATSALAKFCGSEPTRAFCSDTFARSQLSMIVGEAIHAQCEDGSPAATAQPCLRVEIILVSRVFLIRAIEHARSTARNVGLDGHTESLGALATAILDRRSEPDRPASREGEPTASDAPPPAARMGDGSTQGYALNARAAVAATRGIRLKQTFERPVVMGFRAVRTDIIKEGAER